MGQVTGTKIPSAEVAQTIWDNKLQEAKRQLELDSAECISVMDKLVSDAIACGHTQVKLHVPSSFSDKIFNFSREFIKERMKGLGYKVRDGYYIGTICWDFSPIDVKKG